MMSNFLLYTTTALSLWLLVLLSDNNNNNNNFVSCSTSNNLPRVQRRLRRGANNNTTNNEAPKDLKVLEPTQQRRLQTDLAPASDEDTSEDTTEPTFLPTPEIFESSSFDGNSTSSDSDEESSNSDASSTCFSGVGVDVPGCSCHPSCGTCGYLDAPTGEQDCITCADGSDVTAVFGDGTGTCGDESGGSSDGDESGGSSDGDESGGSSDGDESGGSSDGDESGGSGDGVTQVSLPVYQRPVIFNPNPLVDIRSTRVQRDFTVSNLNRAPARLNTWNAAQRGPLPDSIQGPTIYA